jgi:hypothetical protein
MKLVFLFGISLGRIDQKKSMNPLLQEKIKNEFSLEWCHCKIFSPKKESICWNMSIPIYFLNCALVKEDISPFVFFGSF